MYRIAYDLLLVVVALIAALALAYLVIEGE